MPSRTKPVQFHPRPRGVRSDGSPPDGSRRAPGNLVADLSVRMPAALGDRAMIAALVTNAEPRNREVEAAKARERSRARFGNADAA